MNYYRKTVKSENVYVSNVDVGKRITTFLETKCPEVYPDGKILSRARKSLWKYIRKNVPSNMTNDTTNSKAMRYSYHEKFIGEAMNNWLSDVYPQILKDAGLQKRT